MAWILGLQYFRENLELGPGGERGPGNDMLRSTTVRIGANVMGRRMFDAGLLDELIVQVGSVTLEKGKPLFPRRVLHPTLRLVSLQQMRSSMVELPYAVERPTEPR